VIRYPTVIGTGCFIAGHAVINAGVSIGDRVVLPPISVVTKDAPAGTIVRGSPVKPLTKVAGAFVRRLRDELLVQRGGQV
jgi:acetyltransferase-like isoleucine patch superfamily enzyme